MNIGASTSCFYPLETEKSLAKLGETGIGLTEVFFNAHSELQPDFLSELHRVADGFGMKICSVHPYLSFGESYLLFGNYERRFLDTLEYYRHFFDAANILGADKLVIHGEKLPGCLEEKEYFERFARLARLGAEQGVCVTQENVVRFRSQSADFLERMRGWIGDDFKMTLDLKQARRAGGDAFDFIDRLFESIVHVHASDWLGERDCMLPGTGCFDFTNLFLKMKSKGYKGDCIVELYRHSFENDSEVADSVRFLSNLLSKFE